jgi:hypothetical protein
MKMKNQRVTYLIVIGICFLGSLASIFFPYLEKLNVVAGNLDLPISVPGYEFENIPFVMITMVLAAFTNLNWSFFLSIVHLGLVYLTRTAIHFQGFIDHDYDSKAGLGYYLLFAFSIIFFLATTVYWISVFWLRKAPPNN